MYFLLNQSHDRTRQKLSIAEAPGLHGPLKWFEFTPPEAPLKAITKIIEK